MGGLEGKWKEPQAREGHQLSQMQRTNMGYQSKQARDVLRDDTSNRQATGSMLHNSKGPNRELTSTLVIQTAFLGLQRYVSYYLETDEPEGGVISRLS